MSQFDNDAVYGVCPCGFNGQLEDGLCSHCLMAAEESFDEFNRDSILEQQELEDFEALEPDLYRDGEDSYLDAMYEDHYAQYDDWGDDGF